MNEFSQHIDQIRYLLGKADKVLVGAGAGLSASGGLNYVDPVYVKSHYPTYYAKGFRTVFEILSTWWEITEENALSYWGAWSHHLLQNRFNIEPLAAYQYLNNLLSGKDYFIVSTNVDGQFEKAGFLSEKIFAPQGSYALLQCSKPCSDEVYNSLPYIKNMRESMDDEYHIKPEFVPRCPRCNALLKPNLRQDDSFVDTPHIHNHSDYADFVNSLTDVDSAVLLELGVGYNTLGIIRYPFETFNAQLSHSHLIRINLGDTTARKQYDNDRIIAINADITQVLASLV
jgi:NAD-dependent SIR2 family protein deacetylase